MFIYTPPTFKYPFSRSHLGVIGGNLPLYYMSRPITPLEQRLKIWNENTHPLSLITLKEFEKIVRNANLNSVHLPYFSPLSKVRPTTYEDDIKELYFYNVSLKWAVLSHLGMDKLNPPPNLGGRRNPQIFRFEESNLDGASLDNARCSLIFKKCTMHEINLAGLITSSARLYVGDCEATRANFSHAQLSRYSNFVRSNLKNAKFVSSIIGSVDFIMCDLNNADFSNSTIKDETLFRRNTLKNANFVSTLFEKSFFDNCDLIGADFSNSKLLLSCEMDKVNFQNAKFVGAVCDSIEFKACNLNGADFSNAVFQNNCKFTNCTFIGTKFQDAVFSEIRFINCDIMGVEFGNANLSTVIFEDCHFTTEMIQPRVWEDIDYKKCDNEEWNKDDDEDEDPEDDDKMDIDQDFIYKQDPISFKRLRRGTGMVMVQKKNANGDLLPNPDCYNRKTMLDWYNTTRRTNKPFTNPKNRDTITTDFFAENGGLIPTTTRQLRVTQIRGGRRNKQRRTHKKKLHKKRYKAKLHLIK